MQIIVKLAVLQDSKSTIKWALIKGSLTIPEVSITLHLQPFIHHPLSPSCKPNGNTRWVLSSLFNWEGKLRYKTTKCLYKIPWPHQCQIGNQAYQSGFLLAHYSCSYIFRHLLMILPFPWVDSTPNSLLGSWHADLSTLACLARKGSDLSHGTFSDNPREAQAKKGSSEQEEVTRRASLSLLWNFSIWLLQFIGIVGNKYKVGA